MNRKQYEARRRQLMGETQQLIDAGKVEEANAKMEEVKALDAQWDAIAQAAADLEALNGTQTPGPGQEMPFMEDHFGAGAGEEDEDPRAKACKSEEYKLAWAKTLMDRPLSTREAESFRLVNEDVTHTTKNTPLVIPTTVTKGIWELAGEMYPYFEDISKSYVNGLLTMVQEDSSSDAGWYEEDEAVEDGKETFKSFTLGGCELSRAITVSWKLKEMSIEDFIPYIQRRMARKLGAAAGYGVTHGKGNANAKKPEPTGVVTYLLAEESTPRVIEYGKDKVPTYEDLTRARGMIKSAYAFGLKIYANSTTIWNKLAEIMVGQGNPMFVQDPIIGGAYRILGMMIKEDGSMQDGEILISNAHFGYHANINKELSMMSEDHVKPRKTDYVGYAIMDGNVVTREGHVLLVDEKPSVAAVAAEGGQTQESAEPAQNKTEKEQTKTAK